MGFINVVEVIKQTSVEMYSETITSHHLPKNPFVFLVSSRLIFIFFESIVLLHFTTKGHWRFGVMFSSIFLFSYFCFTQVTVLFKMTYPKKSLCSYIFRCNKCSATPTVAPIGRAEQRWMWVIDFSRYIKPLDLWHVWQPSELLHFWESRLRFLVYSGLEDLCPSEQDGSILLLLT